MTSGRKSPGAPSNTKTKTSAATVPTTNRPVMISFFCNCILASFENGTFGASAQELTHHWILRLLEFFGLGIFDDFSLIQHSHSCADAKGARHFMRDRDRCHLVLFAQVNDQFVDDRSDDRVETGRWLVKKHQLRFQNQS